MLPDRKSRIQVITVINMTNMTNMWYEKILRTILDSKRDILFVIDPLKLMEYPTIREIISEKYPTIERYTNELELRRILRKKEQGIVTFMDKADIPFDLIATYATVDIGITDIFPLLNTEAISNIPYENYQEIYEDYNELKEGRYERLSKLETENFIETVLSSDTIAERKRFSELKARLNTLLNIAISGIREWTRISGEMSKIFGELKFISHNSNIDLNIEDLEMQINTFFKRYAIDYDFYNSLAFDTKTPINSNILGHIFKNKANRTAMICFDCMGFEEWNAVKHYLEKRIDVTFDINYSFSMLPSETKYSSSALFAGLTPKDIKELDFINEMHWKNEERLFRYALNERRGIDDAHIYFKRCLDSTEIGINYGSFSDYYAIGLVFSFIDRFIHTSIMDKRAVIKNIQMHLETSELDKLVVALLDQKFRLYFVSDHGSIYSKGNGINVSKDLVDLKAKRYLIGDKRELLEEYKTEDSVLIQLKNIIGDDFILLLTGDRMFARKSEKGLTHGGISVEEVVIPSIEVKYNDRI